MSKLFNLDDWIRSVTCDMCGLTVDVMTSACVVVERVTFLASPDSAEPCDDCGAPGDGLHRAPSTDEESRVDAMLRAEGWWVGDINQICQSCRRSIANGTTPRQSSVPAVGPVIDDQEGRALSRLFEIARSCTGQSKKVADFLLAWWNAADNGGWDPMDLWSLDAGIARDVMTVVGLFPKVHPDDLGLDEEFGAVWRLWRNDPRVPASDAGLEARP